LGYLEAVIFFCDRKTVNPAKPGARAVSVLFCSARQVSSFPGES